MATIEVGYRMLDFPPGFYHKFIVYTDSSDHKHYAAGFPVEVDGHYQIDTIVGDYKFPLKDFGDFPRELIASGPNLEQYWNSIEDFMNAADRQHGYYLFDSNSNTMVDSALAAAGLPSPQNEFMYWSPGSGGTLAPPRPFPPPDTPPELGPDDWKDGDEFYYPPISPLVLDLDGDGLDLIHLADSNAYFDLDEDNFAEHTAWIGADDAFLAWDRDGNGRIDDLSELFGGADVDGFTRLSELDSNLDGKISAADELFDQLVLWRDLDGDGITDAGELQSILSSGVAEIELAAEAVDYWLGGNWISHESDYSGPGLTGRIYDVWFENDQQNTIYKYGETVNVPTDVQILPDLAGYGAVANLRVAMSEDAALKAAMQGIVIGSVNQDWGDLRSDIEELLLDWADASATDPDSRGDAIDARHLVFLESFYGVPFTAAFGGSNPGAQAGAALETLYREAVDSMTARIMIQLPLAYGAAVGDVEAGMGHNLLLLSAFQYHTGGDWIQAPPDFDYMATHLEAVADGLGRKAFLDNVVALSLIFHTIKSEFGLDYGAQLQSSLAQTNIDADDLTIAESAFDHLVVLGTSSADVINLPARSGQAAIGLEGDDTFAGSRLGDHYLYFSGDGDDRITEIRAPGQNDRLVLGAGLESEDLIVTRVGSSDDVILTFAGQAGSIRLDDSLESSITAGYGVEEVEFGDGEVWTSADLRADYLSAIQTSGDDTVYGFAGGDVLQGGGGDDSLAGLGGDDTYRYAAGDGHDIVDDGGIFSTDTLEFVGIFLADVSFARASDNINDLVISVAGGGSVRIDDQFYSTAWDRIETFVFSDTTLTYLQLNALLLDQAGTAGDDTILGFSTHDTLEGRGGNDVLKGGGGNDTYRYAAGDGDDIIKDGGIFTVDTLRFVDIALGAATFSRDASQSSDLLITLAGGGVVRVDDQFHSTAWDRIETFVFSDTTLT